MAQKILLVDDDLYIRDLYTEVLKDEGYEVAMATDGTQALGMIADGKYDLVLLDVMLPKIDGIQVLAKIKEDPKNKNLPVVVLTNFGQDDLVQKAINLGSADYLLKFNNTPGEITKKIKAILNPEKVQL